MKRDFGTRRITLVLAPVDMRFGYASLSRFAQERLFLDPDGGTDVVVFVGRHRKTAKVIWADENGGWLLYRRLQQKKFARFITSLESQTSMNFTVEEVLNFMDGGAAPVRKD